MSSLELLMGAPFKPRIRLFLLVGAMAVCSHVCVGQRENDLPDGTTGETIPSDTAQRKGHPNRWNFIKTGVTTFKFGAAFLYEYGGFSQDADGRRQMDSANVDLHSDFDVRDFRMLVSGQLKTKRTITWKAGIMYDGALHSWFIRETGFMISLPELSGQIFIGRTKEGFSLSKVMSGYAVEMMERHMASDAITILADGIKYMGFLPRQRILWNVGAYADWLSKDQSFSNYSSQFVARVGWLPVYSKENKTVLHLALNTRWATPEDDKIRVRSRPEANIAPYFIDSGEFPSSRSNHLGGEVYYSAGSFMIGSEYFWHRFSSPEAGNPSFNGGEVMVSYIFTGESRPYQTSSGIYGYMPIDRPVFKGGPGAWELVVRYSELDLNDGAISGGKFRKITPMMNWYLSDYLRLEVAYGYGVLDRFNLKGVTQFFQARIQFMIR